MSILSQLSTIADSINAFANDLLNRFDTGIMSIITWAFAKVIKLLLIAQIQSAIYVLGFAWSVAKSLLTDIGLIPAINVALAALSPEVAGLLDVMGFNDLLNNVLNAYVTRFVIRFIPGFK